MEIFQKSSGEQLQHSQIVIVSNRGPIWQPFLQNQASLSFNSGGVATSLISLAKDYKFLWMYAEPQKIAEEQEDRHEFRVRDIALNTRKIAIPADAYHLYYHVFCTNILWFFQHYLLQTGMTSHFDRRAYQAWERGYVEVNKYIAHAIASEIALRRTANADKTLILLQDYHLYLVPQYLRGIEPQVSVGHFVHIPWPAREYWEFFPVTVCRAILSGLLSNSLIGFQTEGDVKNFIDCITTFFPQYPCLWKKDFGVISVDNREVIVRSYPISIQPDYVRSAVGNLDDLVGGRVLSSFFDRQIFLRVDRIDPIKNIIQGLDAFQLMLENHPEMQSKVRFIHLLVPSREENEIYRDYRQNIELKVENINNLYALEPDNPVVVVVYGNNQPRAFAAMEKFDVYIANSFIDGMHLGAKEAAILNKNEGILLLSRKTGVYSELGEDACVSISPLDIQEMAEAMYRSVMMPIEQRKGLHDAAEKYVLSHTAQEWFLRQISDLQMLP